MISSYLHILKDLSTDRAPNVYIYLFTLPFFGLRFLKNYWIRKKGGGGNLHVARSKGIVGGVTTFIIP